MFNFVGCKEDEALKLTIRNPVRVPPLPPTFVIFNRKTTNPTLFPWITIGDGVDLSGTGLKRHLLSIGLSKCGGEVADKAPVPLGLNSFPSQVPELLENQPYYISVYAEDNFSQLSEPLCLEDPVYYYNSGWMPAAFIKPGNAFDATGTYSKSMDADGDTLVVGHWGDPSSSTSVINGDLADNDRSGDRNGSVFVYRRSGGQWLQEAYIKAPNSEALDNFGFDVAISGDTLVVGAHSEDSGGQGVSMTTTAPGDNSGSNSGAVYIFKRTGSTWAQEAFIKPTVNSPNLFFGYNVDIDGDTVVVGAPGEDSSQKGITNGTTASADTTEADSGAVYVFHRSAGVWTQQAYIKASNSIAGLAFGFNGLSLNQDTIGVGVESDPHSFKGIYPGGAAPEDFLALSSGSVFVFKRTGSTWVEEAYIKASNSREGLRLGHAIDIDGDILVASAISEGTAQQGVTAGSISTFNNNAPSSGAVYVFERSGSNWTQQAFIKASNASAGDQFGESISIKGSKLLVGAPNENHFYYGIEWGPYPGSQIKEANNSQYGAGYLYEKTSSIWREKVLLKAPKTTGWMLTGFSVKLLDHFIFLGMPWDSTNVATPINEYNFFLDSNYDLPNTGGVVIFENYPAPP